MVSPAGYSPKMSQAFAGCYPLRWLDLICDQCFDIRLRIQQGLTRDKKTIAFGLFPGQLEAVLKVPVYFFVHIFELEGGLD